MTYLPYYVCMLNFINGRSLSETTPPDSTTDTEQAMMGQAYDKLGLLHLRERLALTELLEQPLASLEKSLKASHEQLDLFRRQGFTLHAKETLWLDVLDKALPLLESVREAPWSEGGKWVPGDHAITSANDEEQTTVHTLLVALIQFSVREMDRDLIVC